MGAAVEHAEYVFGTQPYDHQRRWMKWRRGRKACALYSDYGTGKSKMFVDDLSELYEDGEVDTALLTTAKGNYRNWPTEFEKHMPSRITRMVHIWDGSDSARVREERRELIKFKGLRILVMNIEALARSKRAQALALALFSNSKKRWTGVDESTLIKNYEAERTQVMFKFAAISEYRRVATGNPSPNSPMDLWGQFQFLDGGVAKGILGFRSFYAFRARYAVLEPKFVGGGRTIQVPVAFRNLGELQEIVGRYAFRARKEDCLDLPPKIYAPPRIVELTPEQHRAYEDMKRRAVTELNDLDRVTAAHAMTQMIRLHQILCGFVRTDSGEIVELPNHRIGELLEVLEESGKQSIIWCTYRPNVQQVVSAIQREYGLASVVAFHGGVSDDGRASAVQRFENGDAHFMVATPQSGGRGNTWLAGKNVVYYSNSHDLEHRTNSEDRPHRIGQTSSVTYVDLMVPGTLDEKIVKSLRKKINIAAEIQGDGWKEWVI